MATIITLSSAVISIIFGILVLAFPKFLRFFVGFYFLIIGILMFLGECKQSPPKETPHYGRLTRNKTFPHKNEIYV